MIYNYLVNDSFSCDGANVLTNDLVLAKKYLFNTVVWNLEEVNEQIWDLYFSLYVKALEDECADGEEVDCPYYDSYEFIEALKNGGLKQEDVLNLIVPMIHEDIEIYWSVGYSSLVEIKDVEGEGEYYDDDDNLCNEYEFDVDCAIGWCPNLNDEGDLGDVLEPINIDPIEHEYADYMRKYNISDAFTDE